MYDNMDMNTNLFKYWAAAIALSLFYAPASAQNTALDQLAGLSGSRPQAPGAPTPVDTNFGGEFGYIDKGRVIPAAPLQAALRFYKDNRGRLENPYYLSVIDFSQPAANKRLYVIDMRTGGVERFLVAHGQGSDPDHTGYATIFSNEQATHASSLGFYKTAETYSGENGYSLRLDGLSSTNSNARARAIVIHGAEYVSSLGRSWGCPAVEISQRTRLINMLKGGSLIYAYSRGFSGAADAVKFPEQTYSQAPQAGGIDYSSRQAYSPSWESDSAPAADGLPEDLAYTVRPAAEEDPGAQYFDPSQAQNDPDFAKNIPYLDIVLRVSKEEGVDPALVLAVIQQESRFNPKARSPVGALGLMQVMPGTARFMGLNDARQLLVPEVAIKCGVRYLKYLWAEFGGKDLSDLSAADINRSDVINTIAAYNAGPGNVKKYGGVPPFRETRDYTAKVSAYFSRFKNM